MSTPLKRSQEEIKSKVIEAAVKFSRHHENLRLLRTSLEPCTERYPGDPETGDSGIGPCDLTDPASVRCTSCQSRYENRPNYEYALRKRQQAKERLVRWSLQIVGEDEG